MDGATTLPDRAGDSAKHYPLYGPLWSIISNRGWFKVQSPVIYHGAKHQHHGADLLFT